MMIQSFLASVVASVPKEIIAFGVGIIMSSQQRSTTRRAIRDLVEDEVKEALRDWEIPEHKIDHYIKFNEKHYKREIRARFDAILQGFTK